MYSLCFFPAQYLSVKQFHWLSGAFGLFDFVPFSHIFTHSYAEIALCYSEPLFPVSWERTPIFPSLQSSSSLFLSVNFQWLCWYFLSLFNVADSRCQFCGAIWHLQDYIVNQKAEINCEAFVLMVPWECCQSNTQLRSE